MDGMGTLSKAQRPFQLADKMIKTTGASRTGAPTKEQNDAFFKGIDAAIRRAAVEARQRAIDTNGYVET